ncbi:PREDICTED: uncharacterized protein LOC109580993 [Amphimedon queenslandica]|uniref:Ig-like domain-containing protein n=1 Tax=Amphimedon queenslandica TaxID=400682 RepID=A0A1X7V7N2_AMPQE|nr:PREDICTED: uncharacterized protein LOC109580993 [Amphimedon queenslandica]|eukprot:XP_019850233.1 PREDICTED: uncharacterized protein LOC109580993 [Amphimedon queenslandica]
MHYSSVVLLSFLAIYGISADKDRVQCTPTLNSSIVSTCNITSNQDVILNCSAPGSFWYQNGSVAQVCSQSVCKLSSASIEHSGLYYCTDNVSKYFVNIKVLGSPPEFVPIGDTPVQCHPTYCEYERLAEYIDTPVMNFSVKVIGTPPFTVKWVNWPNNQTNGVNPCNNHDPCSNETNNDTYLFTHLFYNPQYQMSGYMYAIVSNHYGSNISRIYYDIQCKKPSTTSQKEPSANTLVPVSKGHSVDVNCSMKSNMLTRIGMCYFRPDDNTNNINGIITNERLFNESCALCTPSSNEPECEFSFINEQNWTVTTKTERDQNNCYDLHIINVHIPQYQHNDSELRFQCLYQDNDAADRKLFEYWIGFYEKSSPPSKESSSRWYLWLTTLTVVLPLIIVVTVVIYCARKRRRRLHKSSKTIQEEYSSCSSDNDDETGTINQYPPSIYGSIEALDPVKNSNEIDV